MQVFFKGSPIQTNGNLPSVGSLAPSFTLIKGDLAELSLQQLADKKILLNIFVSIDTPVCANSVRKFNESISKMNNTVALCISNDLPFAQQRFCAAEGLNNIITLSAFRNPDFAKNYGVMLTNGPLAGLLARAIVIVDPKQKVVYTESVSEITNEPNYEAALDALKKL